MNMWFEEINDNKESIDALVKFTNMFHAKSI
jgi:hypothetical protein